MQALLTNAIGAEDVYKRQYPAERVLCEYKEQSCVELSFKAIKEPEFVGAMYVKKPERLEALAYVVLLAALVLSLIHI